MRRRVGLVFAGGPLLALVLAATAAGQGSTLQVNVQEPTPGQAITVTGNNFSAAAGNSPVNIRLSSRNGRVLSSPTPNSLGVITATFPVPPDLSPGWYLILATQTTTANNRTRAFTPGRTRIHVRAPGAARGAAGGGRGGPPVGLLALGGALVLIGTGAALAVRRIRTLRRPQLGA